MALTQTTYTGNGSTTNYSFTFEYLKQADVKVTLDTAATTAFTFANATTLAFTSAPANGVAIRIFRDTVIDTLSSTFFPGSAIKAEDLNQNFTQNLYVTQESDAEASTATTTANGAVTTANSAVTTANLAVTTANSAETKSDTAIATSNTASTNASAAVATANTASTNATNAVNTANTASANATTAVNTANSAVTTAAGAVTTANNAATDAATGISTANGAVTTANTALANAATATTTANSAVTTANAATTTAGNAVTTANGAVTTANTADTNATAAVNTANAASAAVSSAVLFTLVTNVAAIPSSTSGNVYIEVGNSTGIESFSPLSGLPSGFVGAAGLTVRLSKPSSAQAWVFMSYFANDSESRYLTKNIPVVTGDSTNGSGQITLNCENNSHGIKLKGPPHSAGANYTLTLPNDTGTNGQALKTNGSGVLSFEDVSSSIITSTDFAYKPTSNTIVFAAGTSNSTTYYQNGKHFYGTTSGELFWGPGTSLTDTQLGLLQVGDSVTLHWPTGGASGASLSITRNVVSAAALQGTSPNQYYMIDFGTAVNVLNPASELRITSSRITNGVEPIDNDQVLKYKTASSKWTVEDDGLATRLPLAGGTLTGALTLSGNPTAANHAANKSYVDTEVAGIVSSAPATLDTLNELAAALGDDPNFATTTANSIGTKLPLAGGTLTGGLTGTTASFAGGLTQIFSSGNQQWGGNGYDGTQGSYVSKGGTFYVTPSSGTEAYLAFNEGSSSPTVTIKGDGSAKFNNYVWSNRTTGTDSAFYATHNGAEKVNIRANGNATFAGTVSDSLGPLRRLGVATYGSSFTLNASHAGHIIRRTGGNITVPANVFTAGDMVSIFNAGSGDMTVLSPSVTMYNTADGDYGNTRTIAAKGMATLVCTNSNEFAISGSQLT